MVRTEEGGKHRHSKKGRNTIQQYKKKNEIFFGRRKWGGGTTQTEKGKESRLRPQPPTKRRGKVPRRQKETPMRESPRVERKKLDSREEKDWWLGKGPWTIENKGKLRL